MAQSATKNEVSKPYLGNTASDEVVSVIYYERMRTFLSSEIDALRAAVKEAYAASVRSEAPMYTQTGNELVAGLYVWRLAFGGAIIGAAVAGLIAHAGGVGGISPDIIGACLGFAAVISAKYVRLI